MVLYKNKIALVVETGDKLTIKLADASQYRVRPKDVSLLHAGPVLKFPQPKAGGDFATAAAILAGSKISYLDLAACVFAEEKVSPEAIAACVDAFYSTDFFRLDDSEFGCIYCYSPEELAALRQKKNQKEAQAQAQANFVARVRELLRSAKDVPLNFEAQNPQEQRCIQELENFALGKIKRSSLCGLLGIGEDEAKVHEFLLRIGVWSTNYNPYPARFNLSVQDPPEAQCSRSPNDIARVDLRNLQAWAIDNEGSTDPDDALSFDGEYIFVHVADPASVLDMEHPIAVEALNRSTTLYLPEAVVPMLPPSFVPEFGLGLRPENPALTFKLKIDESGALKECSIFASTVAVRRTSYSLADGFLQTNEHADLSALWELAQLRQNYRKAHGAREINLPKVDVRVRDGRVHISPQVEYKSGRLVQEMMLLAGEGASRFAFKNKIAFPNYSQEAPNNSSDVDESALELSAQFMLVRTMRASVMGPTLAAHHGLGLSFYAQVTSPLRRYGDLLAHAQFHAFLENRPLLDSDAVSQYCARAQLASTAGRKASRQSDMHWKLVYLLQNPDWSGKGIIIEKQAHDYYNVFIPALGMDTQLVLGGNPSLDSSLELRCQKVELANLHAQFVSVEGAN